MPAPFTGVDAVDCTDDLHCVAFLDGDGASSGQPYRAVSSADGGVTWSPATASLTGPVSRVDCAPSVCITTVAASNSRRVIVTRDRGSTWVDVTPAGTATPSESWCAPDGSCFAFDGFSGITLFVSHDAGVSWTPASSAIRPGMSDCGSAAMCLTISDGISSVSGDGGATWAAVAAAPDRFVSRLVCPTARRCYAGGDTLYSGSGLARADVVAPTPAVPAYVPVVPARLLETRTGPGLGTADGVANGIGVRAAGSVTELAVTGRAGIAAGAAAVTLNVTAVDARGPGFLTVFPCDEPRPNASSLNYVADAVVANAVVTKLDPRGHVCIFTYAATDLVVDADGAYPAGSAYAAVTPARLVETRTGPGLGTADGSDDGIGALAAGGVLDVQVAGRGGVPPDASAATLNVTAVDARGPGFLTVYPCNGPRPNASSLNYVAGAVVANAVVAKLDSRGHVCVFSYGATDLVVDVDGFHAAVSAYNAVVPARLLETRTGPGLGTVDGADAGVGARNAGTFVELPVAGRGGVAVNATAVTLNVTAVDARGPGFLTVYPCNGPRPNASSVNYVAGAIVANTVVTKLDPNGHVCVFTYASTDLVVDVNGWT